MVVIEEEEYLAHYGILRKSGRYPWGSGGTQSVRNRSFLQTVDDLKRQGLTDPDICRGLGIGTTDSKGVFHPSTTQLRAARTIAKNEQKASQIAQAQRLKEKGLSNGAIATRMGLPGESSVRALLAPGAKDKSDNLTAISNALKERVSADKYIDVGSGAEHFMGVSKDKLNVAVFMLREQGYEVHPVNVSQVGTGLDTRMKVLCAPGTKQKEVWENQSQIKQFAASSTDGGRTFEKFHPPIAIDPKRVAVRYKEDGGDKEDGVIYVRPGVPDLSIGNNNYGQVRIQVGKEHFLKGMAVYKDDLPAGTDLLFNTEKSSTGNKLDVMKKLENDPELPFGSVVRQIVSNPGTSKAKVTSAMNLVGTKEGSGEAGSWQTWTRSLSAQVLSKQTPTVAKVQLDMTYERRKQEFDEIMKLTNPAVKKKLLETFADDADSAAVHLKAAAMPRQNWRVILPVPSIPAHQVYAPGYDNGERVVLIRYPHAGTFEIPELTVNNRHKEAKKLLGDAPDAIGIHHSVAKHLSGADFDGDTVLVIPNRLGRIKTTHALEGLKNFDPIASYPAYEGMPKLKSTTKQHLMGDVSNLITDMTLRQASHDHLVRAVRHSMVVIDAEKKNLNYKLSAEVNGIKQLKEQYQFKARGGASTLISRKKSEDYILDRKPRPHGEGGPIDPITGRKMFVETRKVTRNAKGELVPKRIKVKRLAETEDAHTLSSGTPMEKLYANHSNKLKALANTSRLAALKTPSLKYSSSSAKHYAKEVSSLNAKLALAERNRPLERQAQIIANSVIKARRQANPHLDGDTLKKIKFQELEKARIRTGARRQDIVITNEEWNAIQAGAISNHRLNEILKKADMARVHELATPRKQPKMTSAKTERAQHMLSLGYTRAEVAAHLGVSLTTLDLATNE